MARLFIICIIICIFSGTLFADHKNQIPPDHQYPTQIIDSSEIEDMEENDFQEKIDSLFENTYSDIDTFAWNVSKVNSGRIDCSYLFDTVKIVVQDTARAKYYIHPFLGNITSNFGRRDSWLWHYGIDIKLKTGDTVVAAFDGIVRAVLNDRHGYGKVVVVRHCWGVETIYGHFSKTLVEHNQKIKAGDVVGLGGRTGRASGAHLHFETRYYGEPFDPNIIIDFDKFCLKSDTLKLFKDNFGYLDQNRKEVLHSIRNGDNLGSIARRYGTTVTKLCTLNRITPKTVLKIGRMLIVRTAN